MQYLTLFCLVDFVLNTWGWSPSAFNAAMRAVMPLPALGTGGGDVVDITLEARMPRPIEILCRTGGGHSGSSSRDLVVSKDLRASDFACLVGRDMTNFRDGKPKVVYNQISKPTDA
jgi:hypothetical protein